MNFDITEFICDYGMYIFIIILIIFIVFAITATSLYNKNENICEQYLISKGFDKGNLEAFSKYTDNSRCEIASSKALQIYYFKFSKGEIERFSQNSHKNSKIKESKIEDDSSMELGFLLFV